MIYGNRLYQPIFTMDPNAVPRLVPRSPHPSHCSYLKPFCGIEVHGVEHTLSTPNYQAKHWIKRRSWHVTLYRSASFAIGYYTPCPLLPPTHKAGSQGAFIAYRMIGKGVMNLPAGGPTCRLA